MPREILHIDLDAFFVSVEQALNPELRGKAVVVGAEANCRGVVASASYEARAYGLRAGMPMATARRLCPHAIFLPGNFTHYQEASDRFLGILNDFSPELEPSGIDEAYLDLTGFEYLYGPVRQTALRIKERVRKELGLSASIGIASSKVVAKVAADTSKPDGLIEVLPGGERLFLALLPIRDLPGIGPKMEQVLRGMGINTIGQLAATPSSTLRAVLGVTGFLLHNWANGIDNTKVEPCTAPAKSISRETTFPEDIFDRGLLQATLRYLSERVGARLREEGKGTRCVVLKLRFADFQTITRHRTLAKVTNIDESIFQAGSELMKRELDQRRKRVRLIGIGVSNLVGSGNQLQLLEPLSERRERLAQTIDRLRRKYGFTIIQVGRTLLLRDIFRQKDGDYVLKTPSLSR